LQWLCQMTALQCAEVLLLGFPSNNHHWRLIWFINR
jgi:hypothetical protein